MRLKWNGEVKKLAASFCAVSALLLLLGNFGAMGCRNALRKDYNDFLAAVVGNVMAIYPELDEETLVKVLQSDGNRESGVHFLKRYGVLDSWGSRTFLKTERNLTLIQVGVNVFGVLLTAGVAGCFFCYLRRRQKKIEGLEDYMESLGRGIYALEIEDNADDELSGLRNEIYKLTVLLKEQAELASGQKKALADSVANISHQLKTPLTSVMVLMDNLSENTGMDEQTREKFMGEIIRQLSGMSWLVTTMLKLSRLEAGVVELNREKIQLNVLVDRAVQKLEIEAEWRQVSFSVRCPVGQENRVFIYADEKWMVEAIVNILKNALEHSPKGSVVELFCGENDVYAELRITDHGTGISEEERKKLFQRFYRGSSAKEDSFGIGLALAKEIVEKQNGYIAVDSEEDKGTTFSVKFMRLPR